MGGRPAPAWTAITPPREAAAAVMLPLLVMLLLLAFLSDFGLLVMLEYHLAMQAFLVHASLPTFLTTKIM